MAISLYCDDSAPLPPRKLKISSKPSSVETCGRAFFDVNEKSHLCTKRIDDDLNSPVNRKLSTDEDLSPKKEAFKSRTKTGMFKLDEDLKGKDLYKWMGVSETATSNEIKKSYRDLSLVYHPDKAIAANPGMSHEKANKDYVAFQEAFDILTDPVRRRKYDSARPFDDVIPKESEVAEFEYDTELFYETFAPVFESNAMWSTKQPVPMLPKYEEHEEGTPGHADHLKTVLDFYKFWCMEFDSWRDFDLRIIEEEGEDSLSDPSKADCREEKRMIERENARIRQKYRNKESARILQLAELAEKFDIRVKRWKEAEFARRNQGKMKKEQERLAKLEAEKKQKEEDEKNLKQEEERREKEKAAKGEEKLVMKGLRRDLRKLREETAKTVDEQVFQELLMAMERDETEEKLKAWGKLRVKSIGTYTIEEMLKSKVAEAILECLKEKSITAFLLTREGLEELAEKEVSQEVVEEPQVTSSQSKKKKGKKGKQVVDDDDYIEDPRIQAAEDKLANEMSQKSSNTDTKKAKSKEQAKKLQQQQEQAKRNAEEQKKQEDAKKEKAEQQKKKEDAMKKEKAEEMRLKQKVENDAKKAEEKEKKKFTILTFQYCQLREEMLAQYEKYIEEGSNDGVDLKGELEAVVTEDMKTAFSKMPNLENGSKTDTEDRIDVAAVVIANFSKLKFFEIARRPTNVHANLAEVPSSLRNRVKKAREALRKVLKSLVPNEAEKASPSDNSTAVPTEDESAPKPVEELSKSQKKRLAAKVEKEKLEKEKQEAVLPPKKNPAPQKTPAPRDPVAKKFETVPDQWKAIFSLNFPEESWEVVNEQQAQENAPKKKKAGPKKEEEDFDALLEEFSGNAAPAGGKKKNKGKK